MRIAYPRLPKSTFPGTVKVTFSLVGATYFIQRGIFCSMGGKPRGMRPQDDLLSRAVRAKKESKYVDFKETFDPASNRDWVEVIKDIVAMANSGGGAIVFGVKNDGSHSGFDPAPVLAFDPAVVTDKIAAYTGEQFSDFGLEEGIREGQRVAFLRVSGVRVPMVFLRPGAYDIGGGKQKTAFAQGTVYFRHGAKSEPGGSKDIRDSIERELERIRRSWLRNIRKVVEAPSDQQMQVIPITAGKATAPTEVKVVNDRRAPAYGLLDPNATHAHRQKEVLEAVNRRLAGKKRVTSWDLYCARKVHVVERRPDYFYKPKFGSPQYTDAFVNWLTKEYEADASFFDRAKARYKGQA